MAKKANRRVPLLVTGLGVISLVVLGIFVSSYPSHVEARFQETLRKLGIAPSAKVEISTCLGVNSERIQVLPVLYSKVFHRDPFPREPGRDSHYEHGRHFNYQKIIDYGRRDVRLLAYWSVWENRWHAGGVVEGGWQCVPGTCPLKEHNGGRRDYHLIQYEPTLGSLFADFVPADPSSRP